MLTIITFRTEFANRTGVSKLRGAPLDQWEHVLHGWDATIDDVAAIRFISE